MRKTGIVFVTTDKKKDAVEITNTVLKERLAACVNTIQNVSSSYRWKGKTEHAKEHLLIIKTKNSLISRLIKKIKQIHPYGVPEAISFEIKKGNPDYLKWIISETKPKKRGKK